MIDGAHRLSALLAWIYDDYGDRKRSLDYFGGYIPPEQERIAKRTRDLVRKEISSFAEMEGFGFKRDQLDDETLRRVNNIGTNKINVQWVNARDAKAAESSFFKINQEATALDPVERRILQSRGSASAIAARAITRAGTGHQYWGSLSPENQARVPELGKKIHDALYKPPLAEGHIRSQDLPLAGQGYNTLPFIFDLVIILNNVSIAPASRKSASKDKIPEDPSGKETVQFLERINRRLSLMTGDGPASLGLHPLVYFYTLSGAFQPAAFFAMMQLAPELTKGSKAKEFAAIRGRFEEYIRANKSHLTLVPHAYGGKTKSIAPMRIYFEKIADILMANADADISAELEKVDQFKFLFVPQPQEARAKSSRGFNRNTKSSAYIQEVLGFLTKCAQCGRAVHSNSMHVDHKERRGDGGDNQSGNAQITHPICNSLKA